MPTLEEQADGLPAEPGVYLWKDADGVVLYVGKAVSLRARVKQYLGGHDGRYMVPFLVNQAVRIETIQVRTEKEALLLENSLIKQHRPRYNIKLRDDKNFLHVRIDPRSEWPRFSLVRRPKDDGAKYFGPYHSATTARRTLQFVQRSFPLRTCTDAVLRSRKKPCLMHQLKRCIAPCVALCTIEEYEAVLQDAVLFLGGRDRELQGRLTVKMGVLADEERFEEAARVRDLLTAVRASLDRQVVADVRMGDRDVWGLHREGDRGAIACMPVRGGLAREPMVFPFSGELAEDAEVLTATLNRWYSEEGTAPPEVLVPEELPAVITEILSELRGLVVRVLVPQRGDKSRLVEIATNAARSRFAVDHGEEDRIQRALDGIAEIAQLDAPPSRIECFDNSNLLGMDPVASQVVFIDGKPSRKDYRRYKVKTVIGADDYATMEEILRRRLTRAMESGEFPDLIVVDGGRGQLNSALAVLTELGLEQQPVIGLAKPRTERKRGDRDAVDKIVLPWEPEPVVLRYDDPALRLLQHLRDEAHDTAVGFHRKTRSARTVRSALEDLPGVGPARRKALLLHFGSMAAMRAADVATLALAPGVGPKLAQTLWTALHPG
ncbi:MAG: excinuclease ABC subunit UvrC [Myxococcales bacterium]|nr:excinuclease ABC subunit UvrC [Myxococcales bacterium]